MRAVGLPLALALSACVAGPSGRAPDAAPLQPISSVDVARYAGRWYEIARYPTTFQRNCQGVTADYTVLAGGKVGVVNTCRTGTKNGQPRTAEATATIIEGSNGARLAVNFAPFPLPKGEGNYWVLYLDADYQHALVGSPSGRFLWMLARTPSITPQARAQLDAAATGAGYRLDLLEEAVHP